MIGGEHGAALMQLQFFADLRKIGERDQSTSLSLNKDDPRAVIGTEVGVRRYAEGPVERTQGRDPAPLRLRFTFYESTFYGRYNSGLTHVGGF